MKDSDKDGRKPSASFVAGAVALVFLIIGYQSALFIHHAAVTRIIANHDDPDTVFVTEYAPAETAPPLMEANRVSRAAATEKSYVRKESEHSPEAVQVRRSFSPRKYECFKFDPNTVSIDDLVRLGFSLKQAQSIDNYRQKGGRFRRKTDLAKSYAVEDSVYQRLESYIEIPLLDINSADSAAFETLPGIGKFFASKMVSYREELGGYSFKEQLMDIWHFDREKFDALSDLIEVGKGRYAPFRLWTLPESDLARHPYIDRRAAHSIVLFRDNSPREEWTVENLMKAGILGQEAGSRLAGCRIESPTSVDDAPARQPAM